MNADVSNDRISPTRRPKPRPENSRRDLTLPVAIRIVVIIALATITECNDRPFMIPGNVDCKALLSYNVPARRQLRIAAKIASTPANSPRIAGRK